jgi:hypothetical protein
MKNAFIGHSYHKTTRSSKWFTDILQRHESTELFWDETWLGRQPIDIDEILPFDRVFVWHVDYLAHRIAGIAPEKLIYIPMWDGVFDLDHNFWQVFGHTRILSFSWALHRRLRAWGLNCFQAQFFPDPNQHQQVTDFSTMRGYLWQRRTEIGWPQVAALSGELSWHKFSLHAGMDPPEGEFTPPDASEIVRHNIEITRFSPEPCEAKRKTGEANIYFAPRVKEGIGMTFLEAMARGQCVVAPDAPTMSEYITDGVTGFLYDFRDLRPLNFERAAEIGAAARRCIEHGFEEWVHDRDNRLADIIFAGPSGNCPPRTAVRVNSRCHRRNFRKRLNSTSSQGTGAVVTLNVVGASEAE